jgi:hypothetical protein
MLLVAAATVTGATLAGADRITNQTILREQAGVITTVWGDVRRPIGETAPGLTMPGWGGTVTLRGRLWSPVFDGESIFQNRPGDPIQITTPDPVAETRADGTLTWRQNIFGELGHLEISQTVTSDDLTGRNTLLWSDLDTSAWIGVIASRYARVSLGIGCLLDTGADEDWIGTHGTWTPTVGVRAIGAWDLFAASGQIRGQWAPWGGSNEISDASGTVRTVDNEFAGLLGSVALTYRVSQYARVGVEQRVEYRRWTPDDSTLPTTSMLHAPTVLVVEANPWPWLAVSADAGYELLSNRDLVSQSDTLTYGLSVTFLY